MRGINEALKSKNKIINTLAYNVDDTQSPFKDNHIHVQRLFCTKGSMFVRFSITCHGQFRQKLARCLDMSKVIFRITSFQPFDSTIKGS